MKSIYIVVGIILLMKILMMPNPMGEWDDIGIVDVIVEDTGVPNAVSGIIFRNRLYDTLFEVIVFTLAIMGGKFLLANETPSKTVTQFNDYPSILLARLGATISALVSIELAIRGHLSPGGGFASGVAGGTAIALIAITTSSTWMEALYKRWQVSRWEKSSVLIFILLGIVTLMGYEFPQGNMGTLLSGGVIPLLNILVALKVALGSWAVILIFIRYRGLL